MQHNTPGRTSAIGLGNLGAPALTVRPAAPGSRVGARLTARRDPADCDQVRMVRVMMDAVDKMIARLGILVPAPVR